ncbi:uncharacterized protein [Rutidosis leptorrhynchoides]|uniref:uncharacterized protein n=1 Tax=Rutidosis leptorrhynchoides TaxID=125765 RepID=UPI003A9A5D98
MFNLMLLIVEVQLNSHTLTIHEQWFLQLQVIVFDILQMAVVCSLFYCSWCLHHESVYGGSSSDQMVTLQQNAIAVDRRRRRTNLGQCKSEILNGLKFKGLCIATVTVVTTADPADNITWIFYMKVKQYVTYLKKEKPLALFDRDKRHKAKSNAHLNPQPA